MSDKDLPFPRRVNRRWKDIPEVWRQLVIPVAGAGLVNLLLRTFDVTIPPLLALVPQISNRILFILFVVVVFVQTSYLHRRFNRLARDVERVSGTETRADGRGSQDTGVLIMAVLAGVFGGAAVAQWLAPDWQIAFVLLGAYFALRFVTEDW